MCKEQNHNDNLECINEHIHDHKEIYSTKIILYVLGVIVYIIAVVSSKKEILNNIFCFCLYCFSYVLLGYEIIFNAIKKLFKKDMFDENFLMSIATIGALIIGEYEESIAVLLLYKVGEFLQDLAVERAKRKIKSAIDLRPEYANLYKDGNEEKVSPETVNIGDIIVIKNGEKVPLDGVVIEGNTLVDNSALTGESIPVDLGVNDNITSGAINLSSVIKVKVTNNYKNSAIYRIIEMTINAVKNKSNTEKFITKFSKIYTPIVTLFAILIFALFPFILGITYFESAFRALTFLVVACPCALVISIPLGFFCGIGISSKNNILIKGTNYLDIIPEVKNFVFDKTGTLTNGTFGISKVNIVNKDVSKENFLEYIVYAESYSNHYLAKSILSNINIQIQKERVSKYKEISGMGIEVKLDGKDILVGNEKLMDKYNIKYTLYDTEGTVVHLAVNSVYYGNIILEDTIKESSINLINKLKKYGIKNTYLLTGDNSKIADKIANKLGIDNVYSELLPSQKESILKDIKLSQKGKVAYIGDGINDGPVIALSDIGIAMGNGSDLAVETSDVVILNNDLNKLIDFIRIGIRTKKIVTQNIVIILLVKILFLILSSCGISSMWQAVFADVGISIISILNSLRIYGYKSK